MIVLLSPAKSLNFADECTYPRSQARFKEQTGELATIMRQKNRNDLRQLMSISEKLADLNVGRYQAFTPAHTKRNAKQALFAFRGDVYQGLDADTLNAKDIQFAQIHVRILSGLYGLLRPLDVIQPYRLEMGTKLVTQKGKNLYEFWDDRITKLLNRDLKASGTKHIINLASQEYFNAIQTSNLKGDIYNIHFKEYRGDELKFISFNAKKARGFMTRYIVENKITDPEAIKGFDLESYMYSPDLSQGKEWVFTR